MLIAAAAKRWRVDPAQCHAKNGTIVNASGKVLTYGELADAAAKEAVPKDVKLKPKDDFQDHRQIAPRIDTPGKVDGSAEFGLDVKLPGMLYAALAQSPVLGGKVKVARLRAPPRKCPASARCCSPTAAWWWWPIISGRPCRRETRLKITWDPGRQCAAR